jgi:hypothetical protein
LRLRLVEGTFGVPSASLFFVVFNGPSEICSFSEIFLFFIDMNLTKLFQVLVRTLVGIICAISASIPRIRVIMMPITSNTVGKNDEDTIVESADGCVGVLVSAKVAIGVKVVVYVNVFVNVNFGVGERIGVWVIVEAKVLDGVLVGIRVLVGILVAVENIVFVGV